MIFLGSMVRVNVMSIMKNARTDLRNVWVNESVFATVSVDEFLMDIGSRKRKTAELWKAHILTITPSQRGSCTHLEYGCVLKVTSMRFEGFVILVLMEIEPLQGRRKHSALWRFLHTVEWMVMIRHGPRGIFAGWGAAVRGSMDGFCGMTRWRRLWNKRAGCSGDPGHDEFPRRAWATALSAMSQLRLRASDGALRPGG